MERIPTKDLYRVLFLDPAGGRRVQVIKKLRARSAIVVVGADWLGRVFVLDAWADRVRTEEIIAKLFFYAEKWNPKVIGIEANAQQSLFADSVHYTARLQSKRLPIVPVDQPTKIDKDFRIRAALQPLIANGRFFIQPGLKELRAELAAFPTGETKDVIDACASAANMIPKRLPNSQSHTEELALQSYLEDSGLDPNMIDLIIGETMRRAGTVK
jgi:predicted phage terminase large subunit-like protein